MIIVRERVDVLSEELVERYKAIEPATVGHMLEFGFCHPNLQPLWRPCKLVGPAFTVQTSALDSAVVHVAIDQASPGDVLVIDRNGEQRHACWGGMTSLAAKVRGLAGVVIDGPVTDFTEILQSRFPVYARGLSPVTTKSLAMDGGINVEVTIGGVAVRPGDLVVADSNGVLVLPTYLAESLLEQAEARQERSTKIQEQLAAGMSISELSGAGKKIEARLQDQGR